MDWQTQTSVGILLFVVILQAIFLIYLVGTRTGFIEKFKFYRLFLPTTLEKTKQQLYREIKRHEATEILLRETQDYLQTMIDSMPSILIGVNPDGYVTHWNLAAAQTTGIQPENALGSLIEEIYPSLPISHDLIGETIQKGIPHKREKIQKGHGSNSNYTDLTVYPLVSADISGAVILATDVSSKVKLESMMIQNEKMMSLGELAAGLAHEINNPLAGILNSTQNIIRRTSSDLQANIKAAEEVEVNYEKVQQYLKKRSVDKFLNSIRESGETAAQIVKNMLEFSRSSDTNHTGTNIVDLVHQSLELAANNMELKTGFGIELPDIRCEFEDNLPLIRCSRIEIQQVFLNIIRNAAQAFQSDEYGAPLNPEVFIQISRVDKDVEIIVKDNGPGMPENVRKHIFEPFFTTKDVGKGTGLGLSVSYFIITEHHQGTINVDSLPGEGTTFTITLPIEGKTL